MTKQNCIDEIIKYARIQIERYPRDTCGGLSTAIAMYDEEELVEDDKNSALREYIRDQLAFMSTKVDEQVELLKAKISFLESEHHEGVKLFGELKDKINAVDIVNDELCDRLDKLEKCNKEVVAIPYTYKFSNVYDPGGKNGEMHESFEGMMRNRNPARPFAGYLKHTFSNGKLENVEFVKGNII